MTSGGSGSGDGSVEISVADNDGIARSGQVVIAGQLLTVEQHSVCDVVVADTTVSGAASYTACDTLYLGGNLTVDASADASFRAATRVVVRNGTAIAVGATVSLGVDGSLAP